MNSLTSYVTALGGCSPQATRMSANPLAASGFNMSASSQNVCRSAPAAASRRTGIGDQGAEAAGGVAAQAGKDSHAIPHRLVGNRLWDLERHRRGARLV